MAFERIGFDLTTRCNLSCKHCIREKSKKNADLPLRLIKKVLSQAKVYGVEKAV